MDAAAHEFLPRRHGNRGIGFLRLVRTGEEAGVERDILASQGIARRIFPDTDRPWRTPLVMFEPFDPDTYVEALFA